MMSNVSCLCKKLQIWDMGFCHCWISLRNIVKDLQKTQVEYCWIRPKLAFWCYFLFLQLEALFLSLKLSDLMPTVLMHRSAGKISTTREGKQWIWWYGKGRRKKKLEDRVTGGRERERERERENPKQKWLEECYIIWRRTTWHVFIGWRKIMKNLSHKW